MKNAIEERKDTMMIDLGKRAKNASRQIQRLQQKKKQDTLKYIAQYLRDKEEYLLQENELDIANAIENNMKESLVDRLRLNSERIEAMAIGLEQIADLEDPIGEVLSTKIRPNGLLIGKKRVPLGVVGIIYEARPNVTVDAFGLCFKTGNVALLRGGSDAISSNFALVEIIRQGLKACEVVEDSVLLVEDVSRETALEMMKMNEYIDVLIPRGGNGLIQTVVKNSTVPVIETGTGNCHIYVDEYAQVDMAVEIIENAKTQRYGVCNACESLVIHEKIASEVLPEIYHSLHKKGVVIYGDGEVKRVLPQVRIATEEDWGKEYLDAMISIKVVCDIEEAISHINHYNTGHSEAIITDNYRNAMKFQDEVDAAAVYVNASTRFTDGFEFGFGAEIGISTQKLHARGPMGLEALTTTKYIISGNGQIR